jgi:hypothetical protein
VSNTIGIYGVQDSTVGAIKLGSSGQTLFSNSTGVGIGITTPSASLDVRAGGSIRWGDSTVQGQLYAATGGVYMGSWTSTYLYLRTADTTRVTIDTSGNMGIAEVLPSYRLDVNGSARVVTALGVGTAPSATAGEIRAANEITAYYSDERLKNFSGNITNALDKVMLLNGYYYTENELAKSFGFNSDKQQVGVSAQQVQAVLPEVVRIAPFVFGKADTQGVEYLTVQYEKLVPLLIEAIKELKAELDEIKKNGNS